MTSVSRSDQFVKVHKILKKHYKPSSVNSERSVVELMRRLPRAGRAGPWTSPPA
jgi:hypothetical protein